MKKQLLAASLILSTLGASAAIDARWQWTRTLNAGAAEMSNVGAVVPANGGGYFISGDFSKSAEVAWDDLSVAPSEAMTFAYQKNFMIACLNDDGSLKWHVVPELANAANNSISIASTPDGGVVMACNATCNGKSGLGWPVLMTLAGTDGNKVTVSYDDVPEDVSAYVGVIIKFSADGVVEWHSLVKGDPYADDDKTVSDTNPVAVNGIAADSEGNIFIGGYYKTTVDFGNGVTAPKALNGNVANGKVADNGDAFIACYDAAGNAVKVLVNGGDAPYAAKESVSGLAVSGDRLYCAAIVNGLDGAAYSFMGRDADISATVPANIVYGVIDCKTMECVGAGALKAVVSEEVTTHNAQIQGVEVAGSNLYICGSLQGGFEQNGRLVAMSTGLYPATGKYGLENMTVAVSAESLEVTNAYLGGKAIGADTYAIECASANRLYTYGYLMGEATASLREYDLTTGELLDDNVLYGNVSSVKGACFNNETKQFLATCYAKGLTGIAGDGADTQTFTAFHGFLTSFSLPELDATSGLTRVATADAGLSQPEYFSLQGIRIANPAPGQIVIRRQGGVAEKLVIR